MDQQQIAIEIFNDLFTEEQQSELINQSLLNVGERVLSRFPENFPAEIKQPIIADGFDYNNESEHGDVIVLGSYRPMNSPGVITFYRKSLGSYCGSLIRKVVKSGVNLGLDTALFTIYFVVEDVMNHETFHHYSDYKRFLTQAKFDSMKEEALAVAHAYQNMHEWHTFYHASMSGNKFHDFFSKYFHHSDSQDSQKHRDRMTAIFSFLMTEHYNNFSLPGYRDWHLYRYPNSYETNFYDYLKNTQLDQLLSNGVPVNNIRSEIRYIGNKGAIIQLV
ncbi:MAG: hypothetical protein LW693_05020 [Saprospiraceae bacterium]|jgi:hypothetical protein|nr:hypothetical protein [Saprospiraceae bacterium]